MEYRQQIFIESLVKMGKECPECVEPLKAIAKSYIITEGITDYLRKAKERLMKDPSKVEFPTKEDAISYEDKVMLKVDQDTFNKEYSVFRKNVEKLVNYLRQFGSRLFDKCEKADYFQKAERKGAYLDEVKKKYKMKNLVAESIEKSMQFVSVLESVAAMGYPALAQNVFDAYSATESMGVSTCDMFESSFSKDSRMVDPAEYDPSDVKVASEEITTKVMPGIAAFIARHGKSVWDNVKNSNYFKFAMKWAAIMNGVNHGQVQEGA